MVYELYDILSTLCELEVGVEEKEDERRCLRIKVEQS